MNMERIDSHQHFWNYHPSKHVWMNDDMTVLKKDYGPGDLKPLLDSCNLQGCIAVQANQSEEENHFLLGLSKQSGIIKGIVGWVDLQATDVADRLAFYQQFKLIKGFRHVIHDEPDINFMLQPDFLKGIKTLKNFDYAYDILIFHVHLKNTLELVKKNPEQRFVIDHIAKPDIRNKKFDDPIAIGWKKDLSAVAAMPNVYCKISGMVTEAVWKGWKQDDFTFYMDAVVTMFGTDRIMYGSDWPVCTLSGSYAEVYNIVHDYFSAFTDTEQDNFFGKNAERFYKL
jgi:L-fuconolactonase